jgi:hypothetical protein
MVIKSFRIAKINTFIGASFGMFSVGFGVSTYGLNIDLGFFWFEVSW